ncbi:SDR family NAD(P)-dependent oxidoreductase [Neorhizobium galegae]|uniref:SDR family NAD(P)-dependent oxidoreductase n=1 Tax=Neorhizobium galegae TaxID=399 RepID=UPI000621F11D|nr:SDR family NAD(P)-dependent oxidoreductase [Neorhizobium galegae]CDZ56758.1 Putative deoxygluconate dehydrogenase [Neorhizobium galegae bv. orientalis]KAB1122822.1 SDR family oxidoreductase [Neorhizobium galegae]MCQ1570198.1 SDR family oxidoreductase [Neorhizobium galegae]MCQ1807733.1 SDR family oxidoreductase [Neorhizobium galegae]CDZ64073.1 Putative deoxygluconate dehydrogenase [Neorhizobium galegae bv. orientalis]
MQAEKLFDLKGQVAIVTGAASGLGLAITKTLAANGAHVALLDLDAKALAAAHQWLNGQGFSAESHQVDVSDSAALRNTIDGIAEKHGHLDILVANAGISGGPNSRTEAGAIENVRDDLWNKVVDVNLTATFIAIQSAARHMKKQKSGRIVAIASIAGLRADPMTGYAYASSKGAVVNLVKQASWELAPYNVLVNGIAPGPFRTNIAGGRIREPEVEKAFADTVPLGRIAETDEIMGLALLLASKASSFMTGAVIPIDGGTVAI